MAGTPPNTTLLLDTDAWDFALDAAGNWAMAAPPYAVGQDAASECRTFLAEVYYDTLRGIPYLADDLGLAPPAGLLRAQLAAASALVPGVTGARVFLTGLAARRVTGQVQVTDVAGNVTALGF